MKIIALYLPAVISVAIRYQRGNKRKWEVIDYIREYAIAVIVNTVLTQFIVQYLLSSDEIIDISAFERFFFYTKYMVIACILAFILPYVWEVLNKLVSVSFKVGENHEEKKQ